MLVSAALRTIQHQKIPVPARDTWITSDADSFYHMRRVDRFLNEGSIDGRDDALNHPHGSPIPWPPYYTGVAGALTGPFAPEAEPARRDFLERHVASLPRAFGAATSGVAAVAGWVLAGLGGALLAGLLHALSAASIVYSRLGNGDHHAWITLLSGAQLLLLGGGLRHAGDARRAALWGGAAGAAAGVALGSWVASVLYVLPVQIALGWMLLVHARTEQRGLPWLGLSFHAAALVVVLPAVALSSWNETHPWIVVNLSWFHAAWLIVGGLVFVPLLRLPGPRARAAYPWIVGAALALLGIVLLGTGVGPGAGMREGFAWMARNDAFMGAVWESRGILGEDAAFDPTEILGHGLLLLPFAWAMLAWRAFVRGRHELLPWAVAVPLLFLQAARQVRFTDALALPMAVTIAWGVVTVWRERFAGGSKRRRLPDGVAAVVVVVLAALMNVGTLSRTREATARDPELPGQPEQPSATVARELAEWIRTGTPDDGPAVLASWTWGHLIEWAADRPSVATNFGTFVGEEAFRAPSRFFLAEDPAAAERILRDRDARWVLVTTWLPNRVSHMIRATDPALSSRYTERGGADDGVQLRFEWYRTIGARMLFEGRTMLPDGGFGPPIDFARIVYVSPQRDPRYRMRPDPAPAGWVWERVEGARLEASGSPGDVLEVAVAVRYAIGRHEVVWTGSGVAGEDGIARVRVPYATDAPNGGGVAAGPARWRMAGREGTVVVPEAAVTAGEVVALGG